MTAMSSLHPLDRKETDLVDSLRQVVHLQPKEVEVIREQALMVNEFRRYYDSDHPVVLNASVKEILNKRGSKYRFAINYAKLVADTAADRLDLSAIRMGEDSALQKWIDYQLQMNLFDTFQSDAHFISLRDGDVFIIPSMENRMNRGRRWIKLHINYAFNGEVGVVPLYNGDELEAVIKISDGMMGEKNLTLYEHHRISRYQTTGNQWVLISTQPWRPGILPVVHIAADRLPQESFGRSALMPILSPQDILNSSVITSVGAAYLAGFPTGEWKGSTQMTAPASVAPGQIEEFQSDEADLLRSMGFKYNDAPKMDSIMGLTSDLVWHIASVSNTPQAIGSLANISGETIKQLENKLQAKVRKAQIRLTGQWRNLLELLIAIERSYGSQDFTYEPGSITFNWRDAQIRNDLEAVTIAEVIARITKNIKLFYQMTSPITGLDNAAIEAAIVNNAETASSATETADNSADEAAEQTND